MPLVDAKMARIESKLRQILATNKGTSLGTKQAPLNEAYLRGDDGAVFRLTVVSGAVSLERVG